jgi:RNA polymerase sigma-70 factor (ECF subfamily)
LTELEPHRQALWDVCYRMTGSAADADDLVQETFARALARPPGRGVEARLRGWLVRVAINLARDHLRARRRRGYVGVWLPAPVELDDLPAPEEAAPPARYDRAESASLAFLLALEALTPLQRAVLLLCDVLDYSAREAGLALGISAGAARVLHHRARAAMAHYDRERCPSSAELEGRTGAALAAWAGALAAGDAAALERVLARDVRVRSDGGGKYLAALQPIVGRDRVLRFLRGVTQQVGAPRFRLARLNALPGLVLEWEAPPPRVAPRQAIQVLPDAEGRVREILLVLAPDKLGHIRPA